MGYKQEQEYRKRPAVTNPKLPTFPGALIIIIGILPYLGNIKNLQRAHYLERRRESRGYIESFGPRKILFKIGLSDFQIKSGEKTILYWFHSTCVYVCSLKKRRNKKIKIERVELLLDRSEEICLSCNSTLFSYTQFSFALTFTKKKSYLRLFLIFLNFSFFISLSLSSSFLLSFSHSRFSLFRIVFKPLCSLATDFWPHNVTKTSSSTFEKICLSLSSDFFLVQLKIRLFVLHLV